MCLCHDRKVSLHTAADDCYYLYFIYKYYYLLLFVDPRLFLDYSLTLQNVRKQWKDIHPCFVTVTPLSVLFWPTL